MALIRLFEFADAQPLPLSSEEQKSFALYLEEVWHNRQFLWDPSSQDESLGQAFFQWQNGQIRAKNYVGFLHYQDLEIQILPKLFAHKPQLETQQVFQHLMYYLSYTHTLSLPFTLQEFAAEDTKHFQDLWTYFFVTFCEKTLLEHPYKYYEEQAEVSPYFRGRLDIPAYLNQSLATGQWQNMPMQHAPFVYDNLFNQILKYVLQSLLQQVSAAFLEDKISQVLHLLQDIREGIYHYSDCQKITYSALHIPHKLILDNCKLFLLNQQINEQSGTFHSFAFLLPMERIYEDFIFGFINQHFPQYKAEQQSSDFLAKTRIGEKSVFQIRNDIYLPEHQLIIDTKYKLRDYPFQDEKTGVASEDVYQMLSYCIARDCQQVTLLYPARYQESDIAQKQRTFIIEGGLLGNNAIEVNAWDIDITLDRTENFKEKLDTKIYQQLQICLEQSIA